MIPDPRKACYLRGFGQPVGADAFCDQPESIPEIVEVLNTARTLGRKVVLRGSGMSYNDSSILAEQIGLDLRRMNSISIADGIAEVGAGATLTELWRACLPLGFWPPVLSGTARPTIAGALAHNIHGKTSFKSGTLGENVESITVLKTGGETVRLIPQDAEFWSVAGGLGLCGIIVSARLRLKKIESGGMEVQAAVCKNLDDHFSAFEQHEESADAMVSWVDMFGRGRGLFHCANYAKTPIGFDPEKQLRSSPILGVLPRSQAWRLFKMFQNPAGMRLLNAAKYASAKMLERGKTHVQSLGEFHFLLDAAAGWERAYDPQGLIQVQIFAPSDMAPSLFAEILDCQQMRNHFSTLAVMKRHKPSPMTLDYGVDGYSLAMDFARLSDGNPPKVCQEILLIALDRGAKTYLAKDSLLDPNRFEQMVGIEQLRAFQDHRRAYDPEGLLSSQLARRIGLD